MKAIPISFILGLALAFSLIADEADGQPGYGRCGIPNRPASLLMPGDTWMETVPFKDPRMVEDGCKLALIGEPEPMIMESDEVSFTTPSIAKLFDLLEFLMPLPIAKMERKMSTQLALDRADLAIELGFLMADGLLMVQAGHLEKLEGLAEELKRYTKGLGAGAKVNRHGMVLSGHIKDRNLPQLKKAVVAMQSDVECEFVALKDADLVRLISLGGWIRGLEVTAAAVDMRFSPERAGKLMRSEIVDDYIKWIGGFEPRTASRPKYLEMRDILEVLSREMLPEEGNDPTKERIADIRKTTDKLVTRALQRQQ